MTQKKTIPSVSVTYAGNGRSTKVDELGMQPMQVRAYEKRGEQYLLIKSPPASGKSRALMFIALDKLHHQGVRQAIVAVPERAIGASFNDEALTEHGFWADWEIKPEWNLCNSPGTDSTRVRSIQRFLEGTDKILLCTHATLRFAINELGVGSFDERLIAVDEFHHVSADPDNVLGQQVTQIIERDQAHIVAMTGSYFRGDAVAVLRPQEEAKFETVTYTYYEQLNGYEHLRMLDIGYYFYVGSYVDNLLEVLNPAEKTIVHIPSVNARESTNDKYKELEDIIGTLGEMVGTDEDTGFYLVKASDGRILRVADLVDDEPAKRNRVVSALKDPEKKHSRDHVDVIVALGMAKEGFDWIWCEHALTVGYRASLTEIVQIIGRVTRDAPGKSYARFTNLIAEPDASSEQVAEAVNDTLKAIAASLLMEQVLAPKFDFTSKTPDSGPKPDVDYGPEDYDPEASNVGLNSTTGQVHVEIKGLAELQSPEAERICREDLTELIAELVQDQSTLERGVFDEDIPPQEITQIRMGKIIKERYSAVSEADHEAIRQRAVAAFNLTQIAKPTSVPDESPRASGNTALIDGIRRYATNVRDIDVDLIDSINPFGGSYSIIAKSMTSECLRKLNEVIAGKRSRLTREEARSLTERAAKFQEEHHRLPSIDSADSWERRLAEGIATLKRMVAEDEDE